MAWEKSPQELVDRFMAVVPEAPDVTQRSMFGYPSATVGGHMFMGLHQANMVLRLPAEDLAAFKAAGATDFEPMPGRPMSGFGIVPASVIADEAELRSWVDRALVGARAMPPKAAKPRKATSATKQG
jgi:TfoX/Sxy family transcriptional regulator of competence genes